MYPEEGERAAGRNNKSRSAGGFGGQLRLGRRFRGQEGTEAREERKRERARTVGEETVAGGRQAGTEVHPTGRGVNVVKIGMPNTK